MGNFYTPGPGVGYGGGGTRLAATVASILGGLRKGYMARALQGYGNAERQYQVAKIQYDATSQMAQQQPDNPQVQEALKIAFSNMEQAYDNFINYGQKAAGGKGTKAGAGQGKKGQAQGDRMSQIGGAFKRFLVGPNPFEGGTRMPPSTPPQVSLPPGASKSTGAPGFQRALSSVPGTALVPGTQVSIGGQPATVTNKPVPSGYVDVEPSGYAPGVWGARTL